MPTLLVVDDDASILHFFRRAFPGPDVSVLTASSVREGLEIAAGAEPDVVILDIDLPDATGLEAFRRLLVVAPKVPVIFITGQGTTGTAIEAMRLGAYDYLLKPLELDHLLDLVARAFEISRLMRVPAVMEEHGSEVEEGPSDPLVGRSTAMQEVYKAIGRVAPQDVTALILGESGTGKELVARAIYHYSRRAAGPFLAINCAAIPEALLESELFGHERGAFTGADRKRVGKFEQATGGTLFLDEIGDMTPLTQTKILRVLQDQQFERVGGNETIKTDVRIIAATNRDLEGLIASGQFRADLYYRLNVYTIRLPPLRERPDDLPLLVRHFLGRFGKELGKDVQSVAPEALDLLARYTWPGNLREFQSVLKQALLQATGQMLVPEFLPATIRSVGRSEGEASAGEPLSTEDLSRFIDARIEEGSSDLYAEWLRLTDKHLFAQVLRHTGSNLSQAARILGINRATLRARLAQLGIAISRNVHTDED
jgi:two-component system nitrogen regulation response regulator GlnG